MLKSEGESRPRLTTYFITAATLSLLKSRFWGFFLCGAFLWSYGSGDGARGVNYARAHAKLQHRCVIWIHRMSFPLLILNKAYDHACPATVW